MSGDPCLSLTRLSQAHMPQLPPEVVAIVLLYLFEDGERSTICLFRCLTVDRIWFAEAVRLLYGVHESNSAQHWRIQNIKDPLRKSVYLNAIRKATLGSAEDTGALDGMSCLKHLTVENYTHRFNMQHVLTERLETIIIQDPETNILELLEMARRNSPRAQIEVMVQMKHGEELDPAVLETLGGMGARLAFSPVLEANPNESIQTILESNVNNLELSVYYSHYNDDVGRTSVLELKQMLTSAGPTRVSQHLKTLSIDTDIALDLPPFFAHPMHQLESLALSSSARSYRAVQAHHEMLLNICRNCPRLQELRLSGFVLSGSPTTFEHLGMLNLQRLELQQHKMLILDIGVDQLRHVLKPGLKSIKLDRCRLEVATSHVLLGFLQHVDSICPQLESFGISCKVQMVSSSKAARNIATHAPMFPNIKSFSISGASPEFFGVCVAVYTAGAIGVGIWGNTPVISSLKTGRLGHYPFCNQWLDAATLGFMCDFTCGREHPVLAELMDVPASIKPQFTF